MAVVWGLSPEEENFKSLPSVSRLEIQLLNIILALVS